MYETHLIVPEDDLIVDCWVAPPPDKDKMLAADDVGRQELYAEAWHAQLRSVVACNTRMKSLRNWKTLQLQKEQERRTR